VADDLSSVEVDLYKTAVEMADRVSARRAGANSYFLTLNTALAAVFGLLTAAHVVSPKHPVDRIGLVVTAAAGGALSLVWWALLRYYRRLNKAKFDVINKLEERLPVKMFTDEWAILHPETPEPLDEQARSRQSWWHRKVKHREASVVEQVVPWVFFALYLILGVRALY
jgi:hypothetical protein